MIDNAIDALYKEGDGTVLAETSAANILRQTNGFAACFPAGTAAKRTSTDFVRSRVIVSALTSLLRIMCLQMNRSSPHLWYGSCNRLG